MPRECGLTHASVERAGAEQRAVDQIVAAVGYERALDFIWGDDSGPYARTVRVLRDASLPTGNTARLMQLAAETSVRSIAIHDDATLTPGGKQEALRSLQQAIQPQRDALVPPAHQAKLDEHSLSWFNVLGEGRYVIRPPILIGGGYSSSQPISIAASVQNPRTSVPLARPIAR
jgi:hypothetical protein